MPTYCYTSQDGETIEMIFPVGQAPKFVRDKDHRKYERDIAAEHRGISSCPANWPLVSEACAVHPKQVPSVVKHLQERGISTKFDNWGRAIFNDRGQRRDTLKALGMHDRQGGYGDG